MIEPVGAGKIEDESTVFRADLTTVASCKLMGKALIILHHTFYFPPKVDGKSNHHECKKCEENDKRITHNNT